MTTFITPDHTGDTRQEFNLTNTVEVGLAMAYFNQMLEEHRVPIRKSSGSLDGEIIKSFDQVHDTDEQVLFIPQLVAG